MVIIATLPTRTPQWLIRYMLPASGRAVLFAFALIIWLAVDNLKLVMLILFASMLLPYVRLSIHRLLFKRQAMA